MINLTLAIDGNFSNDEPFVLQLKRQSEKDSQSTYSSGLYDNNGKKVSVVSKHGNFNFSLQITEQIEDDICIVFPKGKTMQRLIRMNSSSNTILLTEQCDQACIMCSQPPKNKIYNFYGLYEEALLLAPEKHIIGITGGEPTLEKKELFPFLEKILEQRPDLKFHILSNAQHFDEGDTLFLKKTSRAILWGIPLYSHKAETHDEIVGKKGAHKQLIKNLNILFACDASVEVRTVILKQNYNELVFLAEFISKHLRPCEIWAIMQLENIGYAKMNWNHVFVDTSEKFSTISHALNISSINNINALLYNFPACTVPEEWRKYACKSISDWKNKFLAVCTGCNAKTECCGFFSWYDEKSGFKKVEKI